MKAQERDLKLQRYLDIKEDLNQLQKEADSLRDEILAQVPAGQYGDTLVCVSEQDRKNFDWKSAEAKLSKSVLEKLQEFWNSKTIQILKVTRIKKAVA